MNKQFYNNIVSQLEDLKVKRVDNKPITKAELQEFRKDALDMLEVVIGTKEYEPVKMSSHTGFKSTKHEVLLNAIIDKINTLQKH